jgi:glucokinase
MHLLAIEIGGSKLQICVGTEAGEIVERRRFVVDRAAGGVGIRGQIARVLPELLTGAHVQAIGVGYGGPVRWQSGEIIKSYHLAGWDGFPLGEWLAGIAGVPVFVENDANTAALGEAVHGAGRGFNPVFYSTLGSGVGGGLVVDARIYHGAAPGEVEIGHVRLERDGTIVEDRCSGWAVDRRIRQEIGNAPSGRLAELARGATGGEARHLPEALAAGDDVAARILRESMREYAFALSHVVQLLHPEIVVLGGGLSLIGEPMRAAVAEALPGFLMDAFHPGPQVVLAHLGEDVVPIGALALAVRRLAGEPRDG